MLNTNKFFLSFSAIETFKTCQRKYYYNYIAKLPRKDWPWLTFGTFNHLVLEKLHNYILFFKKRKKEYNTKDLMKRAFYSAIRKTYRLANNGKSASLTEQQLNDSKKLLNRYHQKIEKNEPDVLFTEKYFELDLGDDIWIRGFMDRVDKIGDNRLKIVDYKTSKEAYVVEKNDQLAIYAIGLRQTLSKKDVEIFKQLDFLKIGETEPASKDGLKHDESSDKDLLERIKQTGFEIRNKIATDKLENQWQWTENKFCWCCDFKNTCEANRGPQSGDFEFK